MKEFKKWWDKNGDYGNAAWAAEDAWVAALKWVKSQWPNPEEYSNESLLMFKIDKELENG